MSRSEYSDVKMEYHDVLTEDGVVEFCKAGCLNPNRIPALLMAKDGEYIRNPLSFDSNNKDVYKASCTYSWIGIQTDYVSGGGLITPAMIKETVDKAKELTDGIASEKEVQGNVCYTEGEAAGC